MLRSWFDSVQPLLLVLVILLIAQTRPGAAAQADAGQSALDVIVITQGTFTIKDAVGRLDLSGTGGFELRARVDVSDGRFDAYTQCRARGCAPSTVVPLNAVWSGGALRGAEARLGRHSFSRVGGLDSASGAELGFAGDITMPAGRGEATTADVPFDFSGRFMYTADGAPRHALLAGGGVATIELRWSADDRGWTIGGVTFAFRPRSVGDTAPRGARAAERGQPGCIRSWMGSLPEPLLHYVLREPLRVPICRNRMR